MYVGANLCQCKLEVHRVRTVDCTVIKCGPTTEVCVRTYMHLRISKAFVMNEEIN